MTRALYPGSFDPITNGHLDVARRAAAMFEHVVVGVYDTPAKNLLFDTESRITLARDALAGMPNVEVLPYSGLTVDFAARLGAVMVRGLRAFSDFESELQMAHQNHKLRPEVESVFLPTRLEFSFLSSTLLKEVARLGGDVSGSVPPNVLQALEQRFGPREENGA